MTETKNEAKPAQQPHRAPADAAAPFYTFTTFWRGEMLRFLDDSSQAMEKGFAEYEKSVHELSRTSAAQARAMHDAGRALLNGARVMLG